MKIAARLAAGIVLASLTAGLAACEHAMEKEETFGLSSAVFRDCRECPAMVVVPAGSFDKDDGPMRRVVVPQPFPAPGGVGGRGLPMRRVAIPPFAAGVYEVTFDEWDACVSAGGCGGYRPDAKGGTAGAAVRWST